MGAPTNYFSAGGEVTKMKKNTNKSSRSRLKTVDSKGKLMTPKEHKAYYDAQVMNDTYENQSSSKKKRSSNKKSQKGKGSPKSKMPSELTQRMHFTTKSKDFHNKVKFHPLSKDASSTFIRKSMNF